MDWTSLRNSKELLLGTTNKKKLIEMNAHLEPRGFRLRSLDQMPATIEVEETGASFLENAKLKAVAQAQTHGLWTIGEDSGLCVPVLGGDPGIYSARYSERPETGLVPNGNQESPEIAMVDLSVDQRNNLKLLRVLGSTPIELRQAYYVSAIVLCDPQGNVAIESVGDCWGRILVEPRGTQGFGYDPLFEVLEYHSTFAELGLGVKRAISHRSRALRAFLKILDSKMGLSDGQDTSMAEGGVASRSPI